MVVDGFVGQFCVVEKLPEGFFEREVSDCAGCAASCNVLGDKDQVNFAIGRERAKGGGESLRRDAGLFLDGCFDIGGV